jgi:hypothetical protein
MRAAQSEDRAEQKAPARMGVMDIRHFRAFLREGERAKHFHALHTPRPTVALSQTLQTWGLIVAAWALCFHVSPLWLPLPLAVVGSR